MDKEQQKDYDKLHNQLERLESPFPRPQRRLYKGKSNILVGLGFSREEPVTAVVIDTTTGKLITCRNTRQLLGEDYPLLSAYRLKQRQNARQRYKDQVKGRVRQISESKQGKYLDRLIAKAVVALARNIDVADPRDESVSENPETSFKNQWNHPAIQQRLIT